MKSSKTCFKCKETKLLSDFYNNKARYDGKDGLCKECRKKQNNLNRK